MNHLLKIQRNWALEVQRQFDNPSELPKVLQFNVDLEKLINQVYISPYCQKWQKENIKQLILTYAPSLIDKIIDSSINESF